MAQQPACHAPPSKRAAATPLDRVICSTRVRNDGQTRDALR
jgi:hypothetical protein